MMFRERLRELRAEFRAVTSGRGTLVDAVLPPLAFFLVSAVADQAIAACSALGTAAALLFIRAVRRERVGYALGGLGAALVALGTARLSGAVQGFLLPDMISSAVTLLVLLVSVAARRPLVAWTSHVARSWPLDWYWHPRVLPAYNEVTLAWGAFYLLRLGAQYAAYRSGNASIVGGVKLLTGWPATILLLVATYLYGTWRLANLGGPSVEEFEAGTVAPWKGQRRGF